MKKSILWLLIAALTLGVCAESVTFDMAIAAANAWATKNAAFKSGTAATGDVITESDPANASVVLWHQVSMEGGGMLVVAPVTEIEPVVVALDNDPGKLPEAHPLRGILTGDMRRRLKVLGLYPAASLMSATPTVAALSADEAQAWGEANQAKWARLTRGGASLLEAAGVGVTEITIDVRTVDGFGEGDNGYLRHWDQSSYNGAYLYNLYTPGHAVCGCVATACGALAQFYGTTNALEFSNACKYNGEEKNYATISGAIDWNILPENWGGTNAAIKATDPLTTEQQQLIGRVAYNAGVGVGMKWTDKESSAFMSEIVPALKEVFGFRHARAVRFEDEENPDQKQMEALIYNQVRAGVPVGLGIEGHAVVAVGYGLDADNVERVRVFMGWGGAGDGWYALPKIDTKATMAGGTYLSEIVDEVITMIAYDNDDIVPIVGHVAMPGAKLEIPALDREFNANDYGYFGTRVPADSGTCEVTCLGRSIPFDIGENAKESEDATELAEALPAAVEVSLLNCTVAYSLERAKLLAEQEGKAILRVSGTSVDSNTVAVLDYIYSLDKDNVGDFTNKFVYIFSSSASEAGDGADVSYGVYLPSVLDPTDRWQVHNGALSYGYLTITETATNNTHNADKNLVEDSESVATNAYTYTFAPLTSEPVVTMNAVEEVDAITNAVVQSFQTVLEIGARRYAECTSGIAVTVTATSEAAVAAMGEYDGSYPNGVFDTCGLYEECFVAGSNATFTCNAEVTNETAGVVFGCAGWTITNATTGATLEGEGSEATFKVASNDVVTLTWDLSRVVAVKMEVTWKEDAGALEDTGAVTPGSGWYPAGTPVMFTALPSVGTWNFEYFKKEACPDGTIWLSPLKILVPMDAPGTVEASYRQNASLLEEPEVANTCVVTVANYVCWDIEAETLTLEPADDQVPSTVFYTREGRVMVGDGEEADMPGLVAGVTVTNTTYTTADGVAMELCGFKEGDEVYLGVALPLERNFEGMDVDSIEWVWSPVEGADSSEDPVAPTEFTIAWEEDASGGLSGPKEGFATNLLTKTEAEQFGMDAVKVSEILTVPKGFTKSVTTDDEGNIVATLALDEKTLQPYGDVTLKSSPLTIVSNGDGTVTVRADVANGVKGFWYTLYGSDNLVDWNPVTEGYMSGGTPSAQAKADNQTVSVSIDVKPEEAKRFFKLVVTDQKP